jgi:hypothetical protein
MMRHVLLLTAAFAAIDLAGAANAKDARAKPETVVATSPPMRVQDCAAFYDDYARRGFGWGSGPGTSAGFGTFEGALPRYPENSFPNWYGDCVNWGNYSATGSVRW